MINNQAWVAFFSPQGSSISLGQAILLFSKVPCPGCQAEKFSSTAEGPQAAGKDLTARTEPLSWSYSDFTQYPGHWVLQLHVLPPHPGGMLRCWWCRGHAQTLNTSLSCPCLHHRIGSIQSKKKWG